MVGLTPKRGGKSNCGFTNNGRAPPLFVPCPIARIQEIVYDDNDNRSSIVVSLG